MAGAASALAPIGLLTSFMGKQKAPEPAPPPPIPEPTEMPVPDDEAAKRARRRATNRARARSGRESTNLTTDSVLGGFSDSKLGG